jgi:glucosamine--fructose-6-phosphate aminotransferase (isomerizing)
MCGIIGYLGERSAAPIIMESLKRLEYRGYDSAGVAIFNEADGQTSVVKSAAKVDTLVERLTEEMPQGRLGIGHTRWATHGRPTVINAHPHTDCHKQIMVIHNGIIENFAELRKDLQAKGHVFISETAPRSSLTSSRSSTRGTWWRQSARPWRNCEAPTRWQSSPSATPTC